MNDYDVQMAEVESSDTRRAGDYSRRYRDRQILLRQYPGPDAKRFFSWTRGPLAQHLANKEAPKDMPNVVMDLSYALDHQPGEVVELEYAEDKVIKDLLGNGNWQEAFETPSIKFSTPDKRKIKCRLSEQWQGYNGGSVRG